MTQMRVPKHENDLLIYTHGRSAFAANVRHMVAFSYLKRIPYLSREWFAECDARGIKHDHSPREA